MCRSVGWVKWSAPNKNGGDGFAPLNPSYMTMYLIENFLKISYAVVHVFLYPFRHLTLPVDPDELD